MILVEKFNHLREEMTMYSIHTQGVIESCTDILTTSYWLHVELGKNIKKILCQKIK
jgi:hypothetical protein